MKRACGLIFSIVFFLTGYALQAKEFNLKINDVSGLDSPWPMIASIPFAEGELKDSSAIRIMNGGSEIPSQVDVAATWRDGSIRWVLAGFTASPQGKYNVEYGEGVKRGAYPNPLKVIRQDDGDFTVDTGTAIYRFDHDKLLPENGWLISGGQRIQILQGSGAGAYLLDNSGRTARISGKPAEIENRFIKEGPGRVVVKRSGWYVTDTGEKLAKADVWFYFSAGTPYFRITHSLIFTENTNKIWLKDYGLEFKTPDKPSEVYCAAGENSEEIRKVSNLGGEIFLLQSEYPHFMEREYKATIGKSVNGKDNIVEGIKTAGDWAHGDYGNYGITLVMPWLAERYPKEISFGDRGARAVLWSGRSGKELDFRVKTLVREYFQEWAIRGLKNPDEKKLEEAKSNAQGAARTHDIWFLPRTGLYNAEQVQKAAMAGARQVLAMADPVELCETEAMGYPMLHKDEKRFPAEETLISEYWDRFIIPLKAFPMMGYISWGCYPDRSYGEAGGKPMSQLHALSNLREYGVRREPWRHYARSGERRYYDYGHRFSRFTGDWYISHTDVPGSPRKEKGAFITAPGGSGVSGMLPLFWGDRTNIFDINAGDIGHWLLEYYLTGDEQSLELIQTVKESFEKNGWRPKTAKGRTSQFHATGIRVLLTLFILDWNEDVGNALKQVIDEMIDLEIQNGFRLFAGGYGSMYKDTRTSHNVLEYYLETGDELAKEAFLKLVDHLYRFDRRGTMVSYKNYDGFTYSVAYWMTGDERYRTVVEQAVRDGLYYSQMRPLAEDLKSKPANYLEWPNLYVQGAFPGPRSTFFIGHHEYHNPFIGMPTALKLLSEKGWSGKTTPFLTKIMRVTPGGILFKHVKGRETKLHLFLLTRPGMNPVLPEIMPYFNGKTGKPVDGIETKFEKRMERGKWFFDNPDAYPDFNQHYNAMVTIPPNIENGYYLLSFEKDSTFTLLDSNSEKAALFCPEGFWSSSNGEHMGSGSYGRSGEGMPAFFRVPEGLDRLEIFMGRSARLISPDGTVVLDFSNKNIGRLNIPVEGKAGVWTVQFYVSSFHGTCPPVFIKLLNIEPVVAYGNKDLLPDLSGGGWKAEREDVESPGKPALPMEFVQGISGKALHLSNGQMIKFSKGEKLSDGEYAYLPGIKGTVEFWFSPDRTTHETPMEMTQVINQTFLKSSHLHLRHWCEARTGSRDFDSNLRLELISTKPVYPNPGFQGRCFFLKKRWTHVAFTWEVKEGKKMEGKLAIFLDGKRLLPAPGYTQVKKLSGSPEFKLSWEGEDISIGSFDGTMDMLRISDTVRYEDDFQTSKNYGLDGSTRAFFQFDGNLKGESAFSKEPVEAK